MSYTPTEWHDGDVVTAEKLNNIEQGVQDMNSNYTPTTWVNGDTVTAEKLNNIEQGIANGGNSDLTSAKCTITGLEEGAYFGDISIAILDEGYEEYQIPPGIEVTTQLPNGQYDFVLYKGNAQVIIDADTEYFALSGNITQVESTLYLATGDFTVSLTPVT